MKIKVLGTRGSMPMMGMKFQRFGGATTCYMIETKGDVLYLDAGSGMMDSPVVPNKRISIFLTHPHLDHLLGLPFFPMISEKDRDIRLYAKTRNGMDAKAQVDNIFSQPAWPISMDMYPSNLTYHSLPEDSSSMDVGELHIEWMEGNHPGGSTIYRVTHEKKSLVFATDYEHGMNCDRELIAFAKGCDLLIYDGQYTMEEYEKNKGFGHSTKEHGLEIYRACDAKQVIFTHHNPSHDDIFLNRVSFMIQEMNSKASIAKTGDVISLETSHGVRA